MMREESYMEKTWRAVARAGKSCPVSRTVECKVELRVDVRSSGKE